MRNRSSSLSRYMSSSNFGSCPVPVMLARLTRYGGGGSPGPRAPAGGARAGGGGVGGGVLWLVVCGGGGGERGGGGAPLQPRPQAGEHDPMGPGDLRRP